MVTLNSFAANTKAESAKVNTNFTNINNVLRPTFEFAVVGTLTTGTSVTPLLIVPQSMTIEKVWVQVKTAPTGQAIIIDINKNGTTIWTNQANRAQIAASGTSGTQTSFSVTSLSEGDYLSIDLDQVGSSVAGADLTIAMRCSL